MNLIEGIQKELERCIELRAEYRTIGRAGAFALIHLDATIKEAQRCINEGDTVGMLLAYENLKGSE